MEQLTDWINNNWKWVTGAIIIPVSLYFLNRRKKTATNQGKREGQTSETTGDGNTTVQVENSPGATVNVNNTDPDELADTIVEKFQERLPGQQDIAAKEAEIKALRATVKNLQKDSANKFKQEALLALKEGDPEKAEGLLRESVEFRTGKAEKLSKEIAQDWVDIGNIAYLNDTQKALSAYQKAVNLDPSNRNAWNRSGHIQYRLGNLDKAKEAYRTVLGLAGEDREIQAVAYGNLGNIYKTRGELDKAEKFYIKALSINEKLGRPEGMAYQYGSLGLIYRIRGELDKAKEYWQKSLALFTKVGAKNEIAKVRELINKYCSEKE